MHPPASEGEADHSDELQQLQSIAAELRSSLQCQTLLERQLAAVSREALRAQALPRLTEFAGILEQSAFAPRNPATFTPPVVGTDLRPDDDVRAMDATIPRRPDLPEEE